MDEQTGSRRHTGAVAALLAIFTTVIAAVFHFREEVVTLLPTFTGGHGAHLTSHHNRGLVLLSFLISVFASYTALDLSARARGARGVLRYAWLGGSALAMGGGIWSMHFV